MGSAILIILLGLTYLFLSRQYDFGILKRPGPGALPVLLGLGLVIVGLSLTVKSLLDPKRKGEASPGEKTIRPALLVSAGLIGYVLLWPVLGTVLNASLLFFILCKVMGGKGWVIPAAVSVGSAVGLFWAFGVLLDVPFPEGIGSIERLWK